MLWYGYFFTKGSKFIPLKVDPFSERGQNKFDKFAHPDPPPPPPPPKVNVSFSPSPSPTLRPQNFIYIEESEKYFYKAVALALTGVSTPCV